MGLPVTVYRYTDAGAPQLTSGTPSEWINILKKVLIEGYGSKAPLGWTLEFENAGAYKAAFRNSVADGGTGGYVQFWSSNGGNAANTGMNFQTAASMTALDMFVKPGYGRQLSYNALVKGWEIIGTSRGFYIIPHYTANLLIANPSGNIYSQAYFIGDLQSPIVNDAGAFTIVSGLSTAGNVYSSSSVGINIQGLSLYCITYSADGGASSYFYSFSRLHANTTVLDGNAESLGINHIMTPLLITGSQASADGNGVPQNNSLVTPYCRGVLPGLYMSTFAGYRSENWPIELAKDGVVWVLMRAYGYTGMWIKTGSWYD